MENELDSLISLLKKTLESNDSTEIDRLEKSILDLSNQIRSKEISTNSTKISEKTDKLKILIGQMVKKQEQRTKLFEQFKKFLEKNKI